MLVGPTNRVVQLSKALAVMHSLDAVLSRVGLPTSAGFEPLTVSLRSALYVVFPAAVPRVVRQSKPKRATPPPAVPAVVQRAYDWESEVSPDTVIAAEQVRTLLTDVIRRAAHDWVLYKSSSRLDHRELARDAYVWLFEEKPGHPDWELRKQEGMELTSFLSICEIIDVDPVFARRQIRLLTPRDVKMAGRPAERRHRQSLDTTYYSEHVVQGGVPDSAYAGEI